MSNVSEVKHAIEEANQAFMSTFDKGDMVGMAKLYTKSGQLMPPNSDFVTGKDALQATFKAFKDMGVSSIKLETVEAERYGETASEVGQYTLKSQDGQVLDQGKYIVIWKQEGGQWKLHRDIFNSSMPVA